MFIELTLRVTEYHLLRHGRQQDFSVGDRSYIMSFWHLKAVMSGCLGNQSSVIAGKGGGEGGVEDCRGARGF